MSFVTGMPMEQLYANGADFTALASFTAEASLLGGNNEQPTFQGEYFFAANRPRRSIKIRAAGVVSSTGTPTYTFTARLSSTQGSNTLSGAILGISPAITTGSGIANTLWFLDMDLICTIGGQGAGNATLSGFGTVVSFAGFASPFGYTMVPSQGALATWTQTFNADVNQYLNLSATCSANSGSNTITCKLLKVYGEN